LPNASTAQMSLERLAGLAACHPRGTVVTPTKQQGYEPVFRV
jgi:hypothetical protein